MKRSDISDASMCTLSKVNKDIQRGRLDEESLVSIACYVVMGRMAAGGLGAITGGSPEPLLHEEDNCPQVGTAFPDEGYEALPDFSKKEKPSIEEMVGAGMLVKGFTPSYDDGQDNG